jgi:hypothetical protein
LNFGSGYPHLSVSAKPAVIDPYQNSNLIGFPVLIKPPETKADTESHIREHHDPYTGCPRAFVSGGLIKFTRLLESDA